MEQTHFPFYEQRIYVAKAIGGRIILYFPRSEMQLAEERNADEFEIVQLVQADYNYPERSIASKFPLGNACKKAYASGGNIFAAMPNKGLAAMLRTKDEKLLERLERFGKVLTPGEAF